MVTSKFLFFIVYCFFVSGTEAKWPDTWVCTVSEPSNSFSVGATKVNYNDAITTCQNLGMSLVSIQTSDKSDEIYSFLDASGVSAPDVRNALWTSGNRLKDGTNWFWLAREPVEFTNWASGEPDNHGGNQKCISLYIVGGTTVWNDYSCSNKLYPICEKPVCCSSACTTEQCQVGGS